MRSGIQLFLLSLTITLTSVLATASPVFSNATVETLEENGNRFFFDNKKDSALMCFSLIAENAELNGSTPAIRAKAYNRCGHLYYISHNFTEAYQCFLKALPHGDPYESNMAKIYLSVIYSYLEDYPKAIKYERETREWAMKNKDYKNFLTIHNNILNSAFMNDQLISVVDVMESFNEMKDLPVSILSRAVEFSNEGMIDAVHKRYDLAIANFKKAHRVLQDTTAFQPYQVCMLENIAKAYSMKGEYVKALSSLKEANDMTYEYDLPDMRAQNLKLMSEYLEKQGQHEKAINVRNAYLNLKDSLLNQSMINSIYDLQSSYDIGEVRDELFMANVERKMQRRLLFYSIIFLALLIVLISFLLVKNRTIKRNNRILYLKNSELMGLSDKEERKPEVNIDQEIDKGNETTAEDKDAAEMTSGAGQTLGPAATDEILAAVKEIMSRPEVFCNAGFSLDQLSRLSGYNTKYVSSVINQRIGKNFRQWLAECRIRQACLVMRRNAGKDEVSVEALAEEVGIRSRSNFSATFKQIIGMSPKEFQKQAREVNDI